MENDNKSAQIPSTGTLFVRALVIGLVGGFIWSALLAVSYYFNFSGISPKTYLLKPWVQEGWVDRFSGHVIAIIIASILSLVPAVIYHMIFRKIDSMWVGVGYGIVLWTIVFFLLQPIFPYTKRMLELDANTWITTLCVFILYGLFVGYSISYDYHEMQIRSLEQKTES
ncbi:YqhR family membrane protein [Oceanobacillus luteolus]|uniref:YqhR family membrane protein n=1 Tax=Oceanobacillus luteolus TaxID=1274358 RepID=UPI00203F4D4D|nr:YqhR family membrane protein [Oceanobacillus luteolus]MCM3738758.1 YqhR family membrane protein [Oceanobacillus luteolus]